jgi:hypothetical protein
LKARRISVEGVRMEQIIINQSVCYYSSPEYQKTFWGKYVYIYESKGNAVLTNLCIRYRSKKYNFNIPISSIVDMKIGRFGRASKPIKLNYLEITHRILDGVGIVLLIPTESGFTPVWNTNKIVKYWYNTIQHIRRYNY